MQEFLKKIPIWLIALSTLGLFGLLAYSVYDDRSVKLGPIEIGASHVKSTPVEPQQPLLTPDFDSNWFEIGTCQVSEHDGQELDEIGFSTLPALLTAYYKVTVNGKDTIIPWGVSQYGGRSQSDGLIIDISAEKDDHKLGLYVRAPCKRGARGYNPHLLHLGWFKDRIDHEMDEIRNFKKVKFRVLLWKTSASKINGGV